MPSNLHDNTTSTVAQQHTSSRLQANATRERAAGSRWHSLQEANSREDGGYCGRCRLCRGRARHLRHQLQRAEDGRCK